MKLMKYPLYIVFFSRGSDYTIMESPDFYELEEALEFFDSVASEFKQINKYDSSGGPTRVILQTIASAERSNHELSI